MYYSRGAFLLKGKNHTQAHTQVQGQYPNDHVVQYSRPADIIVNPDATPLPLLLGRRDTGTAAAAGGTNVCGERRDSCQAYNQSNLCCPVGMICYASAFSPSGVYCCASGSSSSSSSDDDDDDPPQQQQQQQQCLATRSQPPRCDGRMKPCGADLGGGCCAPNTECAAAGCLKVYRAEPGLSATAVLSGPPTAIPTTTVTRTTTVVGFGKGADGGVTVTQAKIAETGRSAGVSVRRTRGVVGRSMSMLVGFGVGVAYAMAFL
ncbi:uncharacterized protein F4812DRAFT_174533 [Daldinia caldariorum]|uniref:uncharacterized protein n=1 Tax=Daldinia caldariorum TaxID=326644 RepID=UPI0020072C65|nr:uncharacterized protein F4812DRAFT_174533 [Daldinia caldariorum]KAI1471338.1 hypothetical protein F4812DRAFT_174533 [Daldinia caldariorum]